MAITKEILEKLDFVYLAYFDSWVHDNSKLLTHKARGNWHWSIGDKILPQNIFPKNEEDIKFLIDLIQRNEQG